MVEESRDPMAMCREMMSSVSTGAEPSGMCPMAGLFTGMMAKTRLARWLMLPGAVLVVGGVAMLIEPRILVWLMAGTSILLGLGIVFIANVIARLGTRTRRA